MIYFIQGDRGGPIKIGCACNPWQRLATLQTGNPAKLSVVAVIPGERAEEAALHVRFAASRGQGEWFAPSPDIIAFIDGIKSAQRDAPPKPMNVDGDILLGLSRDQMEAIGVAMETRILYQEADKILTVWCFDSVPLPPDVADKASGLLDRLESIEDDATALAGSKFECEPNIVRAAAFFDVYRGYSRGDRIWYLRELLDRHALSVAKASLFNGTVQSSRDIECDAQSATDDFTVN